MKKAFICIVTVLALLLMPICMADTDIDTDTDTAATTDGTEVYFDPDVVGMFGFNADTWFSSSDTRGMLTLLLAIDIQVHDGIDEPIVDTDKAIYVGKNGDILQLYFHGSDGRDYAVIYQPSTETAVYVPRSYTNDLIARMLVENNSSEGVYEVTSEDIQTATTSMMDYLTSADSAE